MENIITAFNMFSGINKLKYINLYEVVKSYFNITETNYAKK